MYRNYDQAALDAQYNMRERHPDHQQNIDAWAAGSEQARTSLDAALDIPYGPTPAETLDVFRPAQPGAPVQVFFHGGYWKALSKNDHSFVAPALVEYGAAVVVVDYALAPTVSMDEIVRQCRASLVWVYKNIAEYGGDPERIFISGHSAGGHLGAMCVAHDWSTEGLPADVVKRACLISGLYDLEPIRLSYNNAELHLTPEIVSRNSPQHLTPRNQTAVVMAVGADESEEFLRHTEELYRAWQVQGIATAHLPISGCHHFSVIEGLMDSASTLSRTLRGQMGL